MRLHSNGVGVKSPTTFQHIRSHVCENEYGEKVQRCLLPITALIIITIFSNLKFMEVGPDGANGQLVPNPVDAEHKLDHEAARNRHLKMVVTLRCRSVLLIRTSRKGRTWSVLRGFRGIILSWLRRRHILPFPLGTGCNFFLQLHQQSTP